MYGKHFASMYEGSMMGAGPVVFAVWGYVISKTVSGEVELNPRLISVLIGCSPEEVEKAIEYLCQPDAASRNNDQEGRRLVKNGAFSYDVVSHAIYNRMRNTDDRREYNRKKQAEYRAVKKERVQCVQRVPRSANTDTDTEEETKTEEFDSFWCVYPRKTAKGTARKAFKAAMKKTSAVQIIAAAADYAKSVATADPKFIAHPASWLNAERWDDETTPASVNGSASIEDDWDEVKAIVLEKYHPDVRCTKRIEQILTPEQFKAVIEVSPRKIWDSDRFDKVIPAAYRRARKGQL